MLKSSHVLMQRAKATTESDDHVQLRTVDLTDACKVHSELPADWPQLPYLSTVLLQGTALSGPIPPAWLPVEGRSTNLSITLPTVSGEHKLCLPHQLAEPSAAALAPGSAVQGLPVCNHYTAFTYELPADAACKLKTICPPSGAQAVAMMSRAAWLAGAHPRLPHVSHLVCRASCLSAAASKAANLTAVIEATAPPMDTVAMAPLATGDGVVSSAARRLRGSQGDTVSASGMIAFVTTGTPADDKVGVRIVKALFPEHFGSYKVQPRRWLVAPAQSLIDSSASSVTVGGGDSPPQSSGRINGNDAGSMSSGTGASGSTAGFASPDATAGLPPANPDNGGSTGGGSSRDGGSGGGGIPTTSNPTQQQPSSSRSGASDAVSKAVIGVLSALGLVLVVALAGFAVWWKRTVNHMPGFCGAPLRMRRGSEASETGHDAAQPSRDDNTLAMPPEGDSQRPFGSAATVAGSHTVAMGNTAAATRSDVATLAAATLPAQRSRLGFMAQTRPFHRDPSHVSLHEEVSTTPGTTAPAGATAGAAECDTELGSSVALPITRGSSLDPALGGSRIFFDVGGTTNVVAGDAGSAAVDGDAGDGGYWGGAPVSPPAISRASLCGALCLPHTRMYTQLQSIRLVQGVCACALESTCCSRCR